MESNLHKRSLLQKNVLNKTVMKNNFELCVSRLKEVTRTPADKDVALLLGLSDKAFSNRKARDSFPENALYALAAKRADLRIDVEYVMHGIPADSMVLIKKRRERIARAVDAGMDFDAVKAMELELDPASVTLATNRLLQLSAVEVAAINTILESMLRNRVS
jgi:hypothetical protein